MGLNPRRDNKLLSIDLTKINFVRMMQQAFTLAVGILVATSSSSCSRKSSAYDDCILKNVKQGMNEAAVRVVTEACASKFLQSTQPTQEEVLKRPDLVLLDGRAGLDYGNHFSGTLYNGLSDRTITELEITVTTTIGGASTSKAYVTNVSIGPKSAGNFGFDIVVGDSNATYDWNVTGAKAVRLEN